MSPILIVDYDPAWPDRYVEERARLLSALGDMVKDIEHVGSTSVRDLAAKPIVDVMVGVHNEAELDKTVALLEPLGYAYHPRYEVDMPYRRFFRKGAPLSEQEYNIHVVPYGHEFWVLHIVFRDYLRANPEVAREYEVLKRSLSPHFENSGAYSDAKTPFIRSVEARALAEREARRALMPGNVGEQSDKEPA